MLIPITFKNNDTLTEKTKIGKTTPAQARLMNSYGLSRQVGIFHNYGGDCLAKSMSIGANADNSFTVYLNKGAVSIYGGIAIIEENTPVNIKNNITNGSFGIKVNLNNTAGSEMTFYTKSQNDALDKNDLQGDETGGIYEFELYKYSISGSNLTLTEGADLNKKIYTNQQLLEDVFLKINDYVVYQERLTNGWYRKWNSGFKEYHITISTTTTNDVQTCKFKEEFTDLNYAISVQTVRTSSNPVTGASGSVPTGDLYGILPLVYDKTKAHFKFHTVAGSINYNVYVSGY